MRFAPSLLSVLVAVAPVAASAAPFNSTAYWNDKHASLGNGTITDRVISGAIYPQIDAVHPIEDQTWPTLTELQKAARTAKVMYNRKANAVSLQTFCRSDTHGTAREFLCIK